MLAARTEAAAAASWAAGGQSCSAAGKCRARVLLASAVLHWWRGLVVVSSAAVVEGCVSMIVSSPLKNNQSRNLQRLAKSVAVAVC